MKYSKLFPKTLKQIPSGAESINHQLLVRGGFVHQEMAGVYTYLPLGWKVLDKISDIVREEMSNIGGQELLMPALHPAANWEKTGRLKSFDALFKVEGNRAASEGTKTVLGPTHEEIIYPLLAEYIKSYKDLPIYLYQVQMKFRNEPRAKAGLLRGREFLMKDLYSFHTNDDDRNEYYEKVREAYFTIFKRIEIPVVKTKASGGTFSDISEEFQTITPSGEDMVVICSKEGTAFNREIIEGIKCPDCGSSLKEEKAIEVGNIFPLKRAYAEAFDLSFTDEKGEKKIVSAGCYGLGISRVMGAIVEVFHDDKGIIWPGSIAPYQVHLVGLDLEDSSVKNKAEETYKLLQAEGVEVLFDDRVDASAGAKFADADLIGVPFRLVISKKTADKLEIKKRSEKETKFVDFLKFLEIVKDSH
ncbi:MAG: His/Gly/Thr/Pro-type tRNA ligase C-terminal domain-containing protein [Candidatus Daviesbacteria bacterium]|nr:His/Gly/Thr/Pro-type tRNA ligase C-terminal domain-containing protein [Candidatus Daviesbacteria bacterium]